MIAMEQFKIIMENTPLITIDFICKNQYGEILLGKRVNKSALGYYFTPGGRIFKNEKIQDALKRLSFKELGIQLNQNDLKFNGIYEHLYDESIFDNTSTHCINLAFEYAAFTTFDNLPNLEHEDYREYTIYEILNDNRIHN